MVRREIRKMHDESGTDALAIRIEREQLHPTRIDADQRLVGGRRQTRNRPVVTLGPARHGDAALAVASRGRRPARGRDGRILRSEEHTSELQSLMRISYAVFCLKKKIT